MTFKLIKINTVLIFLKITMISDHKYHSDPGNLFSRQQSVRSKVVVLLLLVRCLLLHFLLGFNVWPLFCYVVLCALSSFAIILMEKKELDVL